MSELRKIVRQLGRARSGAGPSSRLLVRLSSSSNSFSPTLLDYGVVILNVPRTMLAHALDKTVEIGHERRSAMYPDTGESGETYDVELSGERVLAKGVFDMDRVIKALR